MSADRGDATFADRLRSARLQSGCTQKQLAKLAGVSTGTVSYLEQGLRQPGWLVLVALAHALGCTVTELTGE